MHKKLKLLAICSKNQQRSPTAETIYRSDHRIEIHSAGTSPKAMHLVSIKDLDWADLIVCMEKKHKEQLEKLFPNMKLPKIKVLEIPDEYNFMDPDLIELLRVEIEQLI